jgi:hypothetical protein
MLLLGLLFLFSYKILQTKQQMISFDYTKDEVSYQYELGLNSDLIMARNFISDYLLPEVSDEFCQPECNSMLIP